VVVIDKAEQLVPDDLNVASSENLFVSEAGNRHAVHSSMSSRGSWVIWLIRCDNWAVETVNCLSIIALSRALSSDH